MSFNSTLSKSLRGKLPQTLGLLTHTTFKRGMAHNPKWLREKNKVQNSFTKLRASLLDGSFVPRKTPQQIRAERLYAPHNIGSAITGPVTKPVEPTLQAWVYNLKKERVGITTLPNNVFNADTSRKDLVQRTVVWQLAKRRSGTHQSLNRSTVSGTGKKPHPQKKSGRARASTLRSPLHYHGARTFPLRNRDYGFHLPVAIRRKALAIVLSSKRATGDLVIVDAAKFNTHKTGEARRNLNEFTHAKSLMVITGDMEQDPNFMLATRNLNEKVKTLPATGANVYDILKSAKIMITLVGLKDLFKRVSNTSRTIKFPGVKYTLLPPKEKTI